MAVEGARAVSVVVPLRNEQASVGALIASLLAQSLPPAEIVLVDGGSTDATVPRLRALTAGDGRFRIIEAGDATPGRGRNVGAAAATNDWIAFADGGTTLDPGWLENLVEVSRSSSGFDVVFGNAEPVMRNAFEIAAALACVAPKTARREGAIRRAIYSTLLRKRVWEEVGGFPDFRAAEDLMFMQRIDAGRYRIGWAPAAIARWEPPRSLAATFRRFRLYSKHNVWAGMQSTWHYGVARQWAVAGALLLAAGIFETGWPIAILAFALLLRIGRSVWSRRAEHPAARLLDPRILLRVALITLTTDLATIAGWSDALVESPPKAYRAAAR